MVETVDPGRAFKSILIAVEPFIDVIVDEGPKELLETLKSIFIAVEPNAMVEILEEVIVDVLGPLRSILMAVEPLLIISISVVTLTILLIIFSLSAIIAGITSFSTTENIHINFLRPLNKCN